MTQLRQTPTYEQPLVIDKNTSSVWYRFFQASDTGQPPSAELAVTVTASPFIFSAPRKGYVIVTGGTVSAIAVSRTLPTYYGTTLSSGMFTLAQGDNLKITYSGKPTVVFFST
jgi:hypothetical protein